MNVILEAKNISKVYDEGKIQTEVLSGLNLTVHQGERLAIVGSSGSGKSTLLHLLGGLDTPTTGEVWIQGVCLGHLNEAQRGQLRNDHLGFIYQFHHVLAGLIFRFVWQWRILTDWRKRHGYNEHAPKFRTQKGHKSREGQIDSSDDFSI